MAVHAHFTAVDFIVFSLTMLASIGIGIFFSRAGGAQQNNNEYLMAGRSMSSIPVAVSVLASFVSSIAILGSPAEVYTYGFQYWFLSFTNFISIPLMACVFLPIYYNLRLTSSYEYLEKRFSFSVRMLGSLVFVIQTLLYTAIVLYGPSLTLESVTGFPLWVSTVVTGIVCTFYTTVGGMKAVIWTDVFQGVVMLGGLATIIIVGTIKVGSMAKVFDVAYNGHRLDFDLSIDPTHRSTLWTFLIGGMFQMLPVYATNQTAVQRFLTSRSFKSAKRAVWMNLPLNIFSSSLTVLTGLVIYSFYASCDPLSNGEISKDDEILPLFVIEVVGGYNGIPGVFVAALFCGTLSTVASGLNALAAVTVEDFAPLVVREIPSDREAMVSKIIVCVYGFLSLGLAFLVAKLGMILQMSATMFGTTGGPLLAAFSLGILTTRANSKGVWIGVLCGFWTVTWIAIGALVFPPNYPTQPMSIAECPSSITDVNITKVVPAERIASHSIYALSFFWYGLLGFVMTYTIGYLASFIFKKHNDEIIDGMLLYDYSWLWSWFRRCTGHPRHFSFNNVENDFEQITPFIPAEPEVNCNLQET